MTRTIRPIARTVITVLAAALAASVVLAAGPAAPRAEAATSYTPTTLTTFDARLVAKINRARVNHGLNRLIVAAGTTDVAHGWSCRLAGSRVLAHNGNLVDALESHGSSNWTWYGENVGVQPGSATAGDMFRAYMNSPAHRANILDPAARFIGVWTKRSGGFRWNTLDFVGSRLSAYSDSYGGTRKTC